MSGLEIWLCGVLGYSSVFVLILAVKALIGHFKSKSKGNVDKG